MDTKLIKTFLEVAATGHFGAAASHLNIAQTTVSARIRALETRMGLPLFERGQSGASLTPAGERLARLAPSFVHLGDRIKLEISQAAGDFAELRIGVEHHLSDQLILTWLKWLRGTFPDILVHVAAGSSEVLIALLQDSKLDIALVYAPANDPALKNEVLKQERLGLFTTDTNIRSVTHPNFIYVDWGPDFAQQFQSHFPEFQAARMAFDSPNLARTYVMEIGGAAYGRIGLAGPLVANGSVELVEEAPIFSHSAYVVRPSGARNALAEKAVQGLTYLSDMPAAYP